MTEKPSQLKPWEAIPAPKAREKPAADSIVTVAAPVKSPTSIPQPAIPAIPVKASRFPEYTPVQIERVRLGIRAGREAMKKRGAYLMVFADAFAKAGGMQVPGRENIPEEHLRVLGSIVLMWTEKTDYDLVKTWRWISDDMVSALHREINRAHQEVGMFNASSHPDAYGWRFGYSENSADPEACKRLAECDNFGLGQGVFPLDEPLVLQPMYDRSFLDLVYRDEVETPPVGSVHPSPSAPPLTQKKRGSILPWVIILVILATLLAWKWAKQP